MLQPRAGGGRLPQLYEATVHLQLRLGLLSRLLSLVRSALGLHTMLMFLRNHAAYADIQVIRNITSFCTGCHQKSTAALHPVTNFVLLTHCICCRQDLETG